jgi:hypothetical protein
VIFAAGHNTEKIEKESIEPKEQTATARYLNTLSPKSKTKFQSLI